MVSDVINQSTISVSLLLGCRVNCSLSITKTQSTLFDCDPLQRHQHFWKFAQGNCNKESTKWERMNLEDTKTNISEWNINCEKWPKKSCACAHFILKVGYCSAFTHTRTFHSSHKIVQRPLRCTVLELYNPPELS